MTVNLSEQARKKIAELKARYPDSKSTVMPALSIVQEELGYISPEAAKWVSDNIGIAPVHVQELVTSYSMYYSRPMGRYHFQVCGTLSCAATGAREIMEYLGKRFGVPPGQPTADGMFSYAQVECLGSCGTGPVCQINDRYFEKLTVDRLEKLIQRIEKEVPDLSFSTVKDELGGGLAE